MPGQYSQNFNFPLGTKTVSNFLGDQLLAGNGISFQLEPARLPSSAQLAGRLLWYSSGFTANITLKIFLTATPDTLVGTELVSQVVGATGWNATDVFEFDTPTVKNWLTLVTNNPTQVGGADVEECQLQIEGVPQASGGMFLAS